MIVLPTMHKRIRRSFLRLVLLFGALGVLMVTGITIAGRVPSELIRMNYDSIAYAQEMVRAMNGIRFPELYRDTDTLGWEKRFADTLEQASGNITEEAERKVITDLQASWDAYRQTPDDANYRGLHARIDALVQVNERGMFLRLSRRPVPRHHGWRSTARRSCSVRLGFSPCGQRGGASGHPLRRVAELFRDRPQLGRKLHLPDPQTLEVRLLFDELSRLWDRLGELDELNVHKLVVEKRKLEVILESVEDGVLVLSAAGDVMLVSRRMLSLLGLAKDDVQGKPWRDLSTSAPNYMALRDGLRDDMQGKQEITLRVGGEERIYAGVGGACSAARAR